MEPVKIPRRIDEPPTLLLWTVDEMAPPMIGLMLGLVVNHAILGLIIGILLTNLYKKYRDNHPDGYFLHVLYWHGILIPRGRCFVDPFIRGYLP